MKPQQIKDSLARLWRRNSPLAAHAAEPKSATGALATNKSAGARKAWATRKAQGGTGYVETHHTAGKPQEALALYRAIDDLCMSLEAGGVERRYYAKSVNYVRGKKTFCSLFIRRDGLRIWLQIKYSHLDNPPAFARDMTGIGHWGTGDLELGVSNRAQLEDTFQLVRMSFDACKP